ncbi:hypothetical protein [Actinocrispum wychmicini]|uniref:Uncharacterized protein n=1 Tax=Actinocrispum wychmicini TaxID=1213861 RepID=A0A4R2IYS0_9PSEU|nr:hypothetical protein [Actinocrispum wychmicini]TCO50704.1 hypothetical protein EV192_11382 [Actinocrispum wychmicini]
MNWHQWQEVIATIGVFVLLTAVLTVTVWQVASTRRAKAAVIRDQEFRTLAERAVTSQESTERRLAEIERILKEVE